MVKHRKNSVAYMYARQRSDGPARYWGDFREFARWGGKREPLCAPGETRGTTDRVLAQELFAKRLRELDEARENDKTATPIKKKPGLKEVVTEHIEAKTRLGSIGDMWIQSAGIFLGRAIDHFGAERRLATIGPDDVIAWIEWLRTIRTNRGRIEPGQPGRPLSEGTIRHHVNALSNLYRRAQRRGYVPQGYNPVGLLDRGEKPQGVRSPTRFLEVPEAALLLDAARAYPVGKREPEMRLAYPIIATFLLTGGRAKEVLGLRVEDVSTDRKTVTFRPHEFHKGKRLKTAGSARVVPLWPQLQEILELLLDQRALEGRRLLFPAPRLTDEAPFADVRDLLDRVAERASWNAGDIRTRIFRVTYATARLQTLDRGAPVSPWTVEKELGHGSREMLEEVYGRLGTVRHRSGVVEYRVEQHFIRRVDTWVPKDEKPCGRMAQRPAMHASTEKQ
jgi:integrase